jgi:hypothetical protein
VIKLGMVDDESYPIITFTHAGWLNEEYGPKAIERNLEKNWSGIVKDPNPPVNPALINRAQAPAAALPPAPKVNDDGSIEGQASQVKGTPNVNDALKTWG